MPLGYDAEILIIVALAGLACGFLNTVASSGSAVSLPILMWVGLDPIVANATNRIPVLLGAVAATIGLARKRQVPWRAALKLGIPVTTGAFLGALLAEELPAHDLRLLITLAVLVALALLLTRVKEAVRATVSGPPRLRAREAILFLLIGGWLGFIVLDGATYLLLALVFAVRLALVQANAVKNVLLVPTTLAAMLVFATEGSIDWALGAAMGLGSVAGGLIGARLAMSTQASRWIYGLLVTVILAELVHLAIRYDLDAFGWPSHPNGI